ncbi:uncharacterized protein DFL_001124 [Arthrobotrys flagrans]|uniref:Uncharacterized protein n=1 Tax=Arthrobotrys flagrans TaxID=97331 RepID=A0A437AGA5_ARTFL|nr:hypothetical protein DFL_001124 [Arthrobotrys flagrans]
MARVVYIIGPAIPSSLALSNSVAFKFPNLCQNQTPYSHLQKRFFLSALLRLQEETNLFGLVCGRQLLAQSCLSACGSFNF